MSAKKSTQSSAESTTRAGKASKGFTAEERAAAKAYAQERKAEARGENDERAALAAIAAMPKPDRALAERLYAIIKASAPNLSPKTWYGMPAYAKEGQGRLLLPKRGQIQGEVRDVGLQRHGEPRPRCH